MPAVIRNTVDRLQSGFLRMFGNIKYYPWPLFFIYDPKGYQVRGYEVREVINCIQPGDIVLRGYDKYLSGAFIPGYFSHAGLYVGPVKAEDALQIDPPLSEQQQDYFVPGEQMVIHAMAQGVFMEDIIDFCRCDRMLILRFPGQFTASAEGDDTEPMEKVFTVEEYHLFRDLKAGKTVHFGDIWPLIYRIALKQIGKPYDFKFNFENYNDLSCTEYVQSCIKSLAPYHGIVALEQHYFGLLKKSVIEPDAFVKPCFEAVWQSRSVDLGRVKSSV
ncbi:MAG: YiiX/YebB-like N1pC/P60 family cysteine hydrolase [Thiolinea sp.]